MSNQDQLVDLAHRLALSPNDPQVADELIIQLLRIGTSSKLTEIVNEKDKLEVENKTLKRILDEWTNTVIDRITVNLMDLLSENNVDISDIDEPYIRREFEEQFKEFVDESWGSYKRGPMRDLYDHYVTNRVDFQKICNEILTEIAVT